MHPIVAAYFAKQLTGQQTRNTETYRVARAAGRHARAASAAPASRRQGRIRPQTAATPQPTTGA
jgi:hypothetical protein